MLITLPPGKLDSKECEGNKLPNWRRMIVGILVLRQTNIDGCSKAKSAQLLGARV